MVGCAVKLGDGPFEPLILLAIVGSVPQNIQKLFMLFSIERGCYGVLCAKLPNENAPNYLTKTRQIT